MVGHQPFGAERGVVDAQKPAVWWVQADAHGGYYASGPAVWACQPDGQIGGPTAPTVRLAIKLACRRFGCRLLGTPEVRGFDGGL